MLSMLEYIKTILQKVSFDKGLFEKELAKAIQMLIPEEVKQLKRWCYVQFGKIYRVILNRCFSRAGFA
jgi:DNA mismatch repair protein MutH